MCPSSPIESKRSASVLRRCRTSIPAWREIPDKEFQCTPPRGFSTFTMSVRCDRDVDPPAVLYRHLEGKENAILDHDDEKRLYLMLADEGIAPECYAYENAYRLEQFYEGRTLTREDLKSPDVLRRIGEQLAKFHQLSPELPADSLFERIHRRWGPAARRVLTEERHRFPENEQEMCEALVPILSDETYEMVRDCLPDAPLVFCHNDTYQGNIMLLDSGEIRLLDFEFSCLNHRAFDFANLFAETVTRHRLDEYPHFDIVEPEYSRADIECLVEGYLAHHRAPSVGRDELVDQTESLILLSDYMYAMAALPLAIEPVQKIRFIPYSLRRFGRFVRSWHERFG